MPDTSFYILKRLHAPLSPAGGNGICCTCEALLLIRTVGNLSSPPRLAVHLASSYALAHIGDLGSTVPVHSLDVSLAVQLGACTSALVAPFCDHEGMNNVRGIKMRKAADQDAQSCCCPAHGVRCPPPPKGTQQHAHRLRGILSATEWK